MHFPIFIDDDLMHIVNLLEQEHVSILKENNMLLDNLDFHSPHIIITQQESYHRMFEEDAVTIDFSLHDDFEEMRQFITVLNPKEVIVVHRGVPKVLSMTIEDTIIKSECNSNIDFLFPENGCIYTL